MDDAKTVGHSNSLSLLAAQSNDVSNMRATLLSFNKSDPQAAVKAIKNVTILRVYHQLERIVRYTEMMDKIEDKMYQSIEMKLQNADPDDEDLWLTLIPMQERLQRMMVESHKLLEPYLDIEALSSLEIPEQADPAASFTSMILDQEAREKVRTSVQTILAELDHISEVEANSEEISAVQNKAAEAIAELSKDTNSDGDNQ